QASRLAGSRLECPSPQPSLHSFPAGRGRKFLVVLSRCAREHGIPKDSAAGRRVFELVDFLQPDTRGFVIRPKGFKRRNDPRTLFDGVRTTRMERTAAW